MRSYFRKVVFCGNFEDAFDNVTSVHKNLQETNNRLYDCTFKGEKLRLRIYPIIPFPFRDKKDNRNYGFQVVAATSEQAQSLAGRIQRESSKRFIQQAEADFPGMQILRK